jgi:hypothetical protein
MPDLWFASDSLIVVILTTGGQACSGMFSGSISSEKSYRKSRPRFGKFKKDKRKPSPG